VSRYDLVVIGGGPAGEKGAAQAAYFGKRVAVIEATPHLGGAGVNTGTIPSKTLRETALYFSGLNQRGLYGTDYSLLMAAVLMFMQLGFLEAVKASATVIYDSRSGEGVEFDVGAIGKQTLECLDKPRDLVTVARQLSHIPNVEAEKEVALLQERGLIFQEGPRYLNLVHHQEPATMSFRL